MRKNKLLLDLIEVPLDFILLILSGILAYFLRFKSFVVQYRPILFDLSFPLFFKILLVVSFFALIVLFFSGVYSFQRRKLRAKLSKVFSACSFFVLILIVAFFFNQRLFSSRFMVIFFWAFSLILLSLERIILNFIYIVLVKKGIIQVRAVMIGNNDNSYKLIAEFQKNKSLGYGIIENYDVLDEEVISELDKLSKETLIDEIILADPYADRKAVNRLVNFCNTHHIVYRYAASILETKIINFEVDTIAGIPMIEIKGTPLDGWGRVWKRFFDIILSSIGLIILIPIYLIVGLIIKLDTKGPVLVKLNRVGSKNKVFALYKFRSMIVGAEKMKKDLMEQNEREDGPLFKMKNDPRITKVGKFIRKTSIDELPNLVNVFRGEMSLVGPRAHEPGEVQNYRDSHLKLLSIKPGVTGMAQVSGRSDLKFEEEVKLDIYYIENWSLMLDLRILLKTVKVVLKRESVA
jgi:exopolysaccharide biosynthesis polyprenyl glycosylphosphotransferase